MGRKLDVSKFVKGYRFTAVAIGKDEKGNLAIIPVEEAYTGMKEDKALKAFKAEHESATNIEAHPENMMYACNLADFLKICVPVHPFTRNPWTNESENFKSWLNKCYSHKPARKSASQLWKEVQDTINSYPTVKETGETPEDWYFFSNSEDSDETEEG